MAGRDIVVIGGSAGAIEAVTQVVGALPPEFPGSIFVVVHFPGFVRSTLPRILSRAGPLPAQHARNDEAIEPGRIYVAPPTCHLLIHDGHVRLNHGPKENGHRPALDPLFRSAAHAYGPRVVGVAQSTVEELETTNEELQSTNEELETMNEELQSTNEELQTLNDELRVRGEDPNTANAFLHSVLSSLRGGVAVVDDELRVLAWNGQATELARESAEEARQAAIELRSALDHALKAAYDQLSIVQELRESLLRSKDSGWNG